MRIAIGAIVHETNSFSPIPTNLASFHQGKPDVTVGSAVVEQARGKRKGLSGFVEVGDEQGWELVGLIDAYATPSANVEATAFDELIDRMLSNLRAAGDLDGVLFYLHGAMLAENAPDAEGAICMAIRDVIGPDIPLVTALDLHGNMTQEFCDVVDAVFVFDTNPHIDAYERGIEAANCMAAILNGEMARPHVFFSKPPMLPPTINMRTGEGPMRELLERGQEWEAGDGIVNVAVFSGFPYADFPEAGTSIIVTATDPAMGQRALRDMGRLAWDLRTTFLKQIPDVVAAVDQAEAMLADQPDKPVILADVADNPGGGGSGDTTALLREVLSRQLPGAAACIWDPDAVRQAIEIGIGGRGEFRIGGNAMPEVYGAQLHVVGVVRHLSDGHFLGWGPLMRGGAGDCGPTALIDVNGMQLVVTSFRHAANDRGYFQVAGVQPEREPLLIIKSRGHFRADFEPIAHAIIEVDAPGAANPGLSRFDFQHVRRPIWPLDPETTWDPT